MPKGGGVQKKVTNDDKTFKGSGGGAVGCHPMPTSSSSNANFITNAIIGDLSTISVINRPGVAGAVLQTAS